MRRSIVPSRWKWPRRDSAVAFAIAIALAAASISGSGAEPPAPQSPPKEQIVIEADGRKVVLVRWAIGSRDTVTTLRIPLAYVPIVGGDGLPDPFSAHIVAEAMLWDMQPVPRGRSLPRSEQNQKVLGLIESSVAGTTLRTPTQQLHTRARIGLADTKRNYYQSHYGLQIARKPSRFGLERIGAIHDLGDATPVGLTDFYYLGDDPEQASDFMTCTDEAVPDDPLPGKHLNPGCSQWFVLETLSATVKINYRRRHLSEWREIKRRVTDLIESWK